MQKSYDIWEWFLRKVTIPVAISSRFSKRCFLIVKLLEKFSFGKTKSRYIISYGIAPEFKRVLLYDKVSTIFYCFFWLRVWIQIFKCAKLMLLYVFGMIRLVLLNSNILTHNFSEGQLLRIYLTVCMNLWVNLKRINCCNLQWKAPMLIGMS